MASRNTVVHHGGKLGANPDGTRLYASVPMALARDHRLTHAARSVAVFIWSHSESWQQSTRAVAESLGTKRDTVSKALTDLQQHGWMVRQKLTARHETWHLQLSNTPFTPEETQRLAGDVALKTGNAATVMPPKRATRGPQNGQQRCPENGPHSSTSRSAPEVHSSSSSYEPDETGPESRSLAVGGSEAPNNGADGRELEAPSLEGSREAASIAEPDGSALDGSEHPIGNNGATEAPKGLAGLQPPTGTGSPSDYYDPFASEPPWRAEAARQERAKQPQPPTAQSLPPSPWE